MTTVQCNSCKQTVEVAFYFNGEQIITHDSINLGDRWYYEAMVNGRAICPMCGKEINKIFCKTISKESIIKLAMGEFR